MCQTIFQHENSFISSIHQILSLKAFTGIYKNLENYATKRGVDSNNLRGNFIWYLAFSIFREQFHARKL